MGSPFSLNGKHVLVTGASSGIGRSVAIEAAQAGASVTALGRNEERLSQTISALVGEGHNSFAFDLCDPLALAEFVSQLDDLDGIVHVAGITRMAPAKFISQKDVQAVLPAFSTSQAGYISASSLFARTRSGI